VGGRGAAEADGDGGAFHGGGGGGGGGGWVGFLSWSWGFRWKRDGELGWFWMVGLRLR
jgi:hypothetical protein